MLAMDSGGVRPSKRFERISAVQRGEVELQSILNGGKLGRELSSLEIRLKNNSFDNDHDRDEAVELLAACNAARALWIDKIPRIQISELEAHMAVLLTHGCQLPLRHKQAACTKFGLRLLGEGKVSEWLQILGGQVSNDWTLETLSFGACWLPWGDEELDELGDTGIP